MSGYTESWALTNVNVSSPAEKLTLYYIAGTVGTDNFMGEIRLDALRDQTCQGEPELRRVLNQLADRRLIRRVTPRADQPAENPRIFDCVIDTPHEDHWDF